MAKIQTGISIDEEVFKQAKAIAELDSRNFSSYVEITLKQAIERFSRQFPELLPLIEVSPQVEQAVGQ